MKCQDCKFHVKGDETTGFCWRYPPQMAEPTKSVMPPVGSKTMWCGEHRKSSILAKLMSSK